MLTTASVCELWKFSANTLNTTQRFCCLKRKPKCGEWNTLFTLHADARSEQNAKCYEFRTKQAQAMQTFPCVSLSCFLYVYVYVYECGNITILIVASHAIWIPWRFYHYVVCVLVNFFFRGLGKRVRERISVRLYLCISRAVLKCKVEPSVHDSGSHAHFPMHNFHGALLRFK